MINKKNILLVSFVCTLALTILFFVAGSQFCYASNSCSDFFIRFHPFVLADFLFIAPAVFLLSLLTYFLRDEIFQTLLFFAKIWVPLSVFLTLLTPETTGSSFVPYYGRPHVALAMSVLFLVISLGLMIWKYDSLKAAGK